MKNRNKLRTMDVNGEKYLWSYNFDDMDFINYPYSYYLFVPEDNRRLKVRVYFTKYAPNMNLDAYSDDGTPCFYKGEQIILNLCRPFFARQMIEYVFSHCCSKSDTGEINIKDGDSILMRTFTDFHKPWDGFYQSRYFLINRRNFYETV